jgi:hypothetical protein
MQLLTDSSSYICDMAQQQQRVAILQGKGRPMAARKQPDSI